MERARTSATVRGHLASRILESFVPTWCPRTTRIERERVPRTGECARSVPRESAELRTTQIESDRDGCRSTEFRSLRLHQKSLARAPFLLSMARSANTLRNLLFASSAACAGYSPSGSPCNPRSGGDPGRQGGFACGGFDPSASNARLLSQGPDGRVPLLFCGDGAVVHAGVDGGRRGRPCTAPPWDQAASARRMNSSRTYIDAWEIAACGTIRSNPWKPPAQTCRSTLTPACIIRCA